MRQRALRRRGWSCVVAFALASACGSGGDASSEREPATGPRHDRDTALTGDAAERDVGAEAPGDASDGLDAGSIDPAADGAVRNAASGSERASDAGLDQAADGGEATRDANAACLGASAAAFERVETRCDGLDNDCDGLTDFLPLVAANACDAPPGGCARGHVACSDGARVCFAAGPTPEVVNGSDDDCDGAIDELDTAPVTPRVLLLRPSYLMVDSAGEIDNQRSFLEQWGIPYDVAEPLEDLDAQLAQLPGHALALFPGYLLPEVLNAPHLAALRQFVEAGGVLIVTKPVLSAADPLGELLGLGRSERRADFEELRFVGDAHAAATRLFDSPEERSVPLTAVPGEPAPAAHLLLELAPDVRELAYGTIGGERAGALVVRRALGRGAIYTLGHNLHHFKHARCYLNCFEPSGDLAGLLLREALREAARGHVAFLHTVPGSEDSVVLMTHDVDARDAYSAGAEWGEPGALRVADLEREHAARGSFMITTDYVAPYYEPEVVGALCERGMCPVGVHSVTHGDIRALPMGDCTETFADYPETRTLCGEVRVPIELVERDSGQRPVAWRSPYLYVPAQLYDVLESQQIGVDSSYAVGDLKFNLPISLARTGLNQHLFHRRNLYTLTITVEDGFGGIVDGESRRIEMSESNAPLFEQLWQYAALRNADNGAYTVALLHPSYGRGVPADNLRHKLAVVDAFLTACRARGLRVDLTLADVLEFWRAREATRLDVHYTGSAYTGSVHVGAHAIADLTLEFGDAIEAFRCQSCGEVTLARTRVVLRGPLAPHSSHAFEAVVAGP
jgi:peptidoglycan/xylan/chitin deacetylase (PgdA/CDA1 family)